MPIAPEFRSKLEFDNFNNEPVFNSPGMEVNSALPEFEYVTQTGRQVLNNIPGENLNVRDKFIEYFKRLKQEMVVNPAIKNEIRETYRNNQREANLAVEKMMTAPIGNSQAETISTNNSNDITHITKRAISYTIGNQEVAVPKADLDKIILGVVELLNKDIINISIPDNMLGNITKRVEEEISKLPIEKINLIREQILTTIVGVIENAKKQNQEVGDKIKERIKSFKEAASESIKKNLGIAVSGLTIALMIAGSSYLQSQAKTETYQPSHQQERVDLQETPFADHFEATPTPVPVPQQESAKKPEKKAVLIKSTEENPINEPVYLNPEQTKSLTGGESIGMILSQNLNGDGIYIVENKNKSGPSLSEIETKIGEKFVMVVSLKPEFENGREEHLDLSQFISINEEGNFVLDPSLLPQETLKLISERSSVDGLSYGFIDDKNYFRAGSTRDLEDFEQVTKKETGAF